MRLVNPYRNLDIQATVPSCRFQARELAAIFLSATFQIAFQSLLSDSGMKVYRYPIPNTPTSSTVSVSFMALAASACWVTQAHHTVHFSWNSGGLFGRSIMLVMYLAVFRLYTLMVNYTTIVEAGCSADDGWAALLRACPGATALDWVSQLQTSDRTNYLVVEEKRSEVT